MTTWRWRNSKRGGGIIDVGIGCGRSSRWKENKGVKEGEVKLWKGGGRVVWEGNSKH